MNTTTRKFPRSLSDAFGPHTSRAIYVETTPMDFVDKLVVAACAVALLFAVVVVVLS